MKYYLYKITNKINGRYYIGVHKTPDINDGYMGSGKLIKLAIKKYGVENFEKEIIQYCQNEQEMYCLEQKLIDESLLLDKKTYNLRKGGFGGFDYINTFVLTDEKRKGNIPWNKGKNTGPMQETQKNDISKTLKNRYIHTEHHLKGKPPWNKNKKTNQIPWNKGKKEPRIICELCNFEANPGNFKRWHKNCKAERPKNG